VIFLAGCETPAVLKDVIAFGADQVMLSFYELFRGRQLAAVMKTLDLNPSVRVFINAGARACVAHGQASTQYFKSYKAFLRECGGRFAFATEFDVDGFDPAYDAVDMAEWQDELLALDRVSIVPIWHAQRGPDAWIGLCHDPRFTRIGLGATEPLAQPSYLSRFMAIARQTGMPVHGFGQTKILTTLKTTRFSSIDSRSWKSGERFGTVYIFQHTQWKELSSTTRGGKDARLPYRTYFTAIGCSWRKLQADDPRELRKANVIAWTNLSRRLQVMYGPQEHRTDGSTHPDRDRIPVGNGDDGGDGVLPAVARPAPSEHAAQKSVGAVADGVRRDVPDVDRNSPVSGTGTATTATAAPARPRITKLRAKPKGGVSYDGSRHAAADRTGVHDPESDRAVARQPTTATDQRSPEDHRPAAASPPADVPHRLTLVKPDRTPMQVELTATTGGQPLARTVKGLMPEGSVFQHCSTCAVGVLCPKYREGSACAFVEDFRNMPTRNIDDVATSLAMVIEENAARLNMGRILEQTLHGGMISKEVTELSSALANQLVALGKVMKSTKSAKVTGDGESLLAKIFGDLVPQSVELTGTDATVPLAIGESSPTPDPVLDPDGAPRTPAPDDAVPAVVDADDDDERGGVPVMLSTLPDDPASSRR
jgi:hypothetical protein